MPTFVTGGTGLLGINLVRSLAESGEEVRVLVRKTSNRKWLEIPNVAFVVGDITDADSIRRAIDGCDKVYHVAGWVQITPWGRKIAEAVNLRGAENVARAALDAGVKRLVHVSSIAAVGHGPKDSPATEEMTWNFDTLHAPYYDTKRGGEERVLGMVREGLDAVVVNPGYIIGPYDVGPSSGQSILDVLTQRLPGCPSQGGIGFVDVREVVEGMRLAMEKGERGERYLLIGENLTYREYADLVAQEGGVAPLRRTLPYGLVWSVSSVLTAVGWMGYRKYGDVNLTLAKISFCDHYASSEKARTQLGLAQHPIQKAVADSIEWFEQNGYIERVDSGWRIPE